MIKINRKFNPFDYLYPKEETIKRYVAFCEQHAGKILTTGFLLSILSIFGIIFLFKNVDTSLTVLLPDSYKSVQTIKKIEMNSSNAFENLYVHGADAKRMIQFAEDLKGRLLKNSIIFRVRFQMDEVVPRKYTFLLLPDPHLQSIKERIRKKISQEKFKRTGFFISLLDDEEEEGETATKGTEDDLGLGDIRQQNPQIMAREGTLEPYFLSNDHSILHVQVFPDGPSSDFDFAQKFYDFLTAEVEKIKKDYPEIDVEIIGPFRKRSG